MVSDAGCARIHKEKRVQTARFFICSPREERGKGEGVLLCGPWAVGGAVTQEVSFGWRSSVIFSLRLWGAVSYILFLPFTVSQSWGRKR